VSPVRPGNGMCRSKFSTGAEWASRSRMARPVRGALLPPGSQAVMFAGREPT
jgi:hypothetical protein